MKKRTVVLISIGLVLVFAVIVYFGLRNARGVPVTIGEPPEPVTLTADYIDVDIDLVEGLSIDIWNSIESVEIKLIHQVMVLPWSESLMSPLKVKAFHNNINIYFYLSWKDDTKDTIIDLDKFSDASAIMFPLDDDVPSSTILMGFMGKANIWHWKGSLDEEYWSGSLPDTEGYVDFYYPFEEEELFIVSKDEILSAVNDLIAIRVGTLSKKQNQNIEGRGIFEEGTWQVVFKRPMDIADPEIDLVIEPDQKKLIAFALWNGSHGDRGGRKSISDWVELNINQ